MRASDRTQEILDSSLRCGYGEVMTKMKTFTKNEVKRVIKQIIAANPHMTNPVDDKDRCVYHRGRGNNIRRCIIGKMGWELGLPTPVADAGLVGELASAGLWRDRFTDAAVRYMADVQEEADGYRCTWGDISKEVLNG